MIKQSIIKIILILLIIGLNWTGLSAVWETFAYYNDTEISSENTYSAGTLDFSLTAGGWTPPEKAVNLPPGESVTRTISVIKNGSLDFQYNASTIIDTEESDMSFCDALNLKAELGESVEYNETLGDLNFSSPILISDDQDDWIFTITLSSTYTPPEEGAGCSFKFVFDGWQEGLSFGQGFYDTEELDNLIEIGGSTISGYSPIADSYVDQKHPDSNYGSASELKIRSKNSNPENRRAFIRFDFNFPAGTTILSANLKLYMKDAPLATRTYEARRVLAAWKERDSKKDTDGIDWNNQPDVTTTVTDSVPSGTSTGWLSWNVTSDVQGFVASTFSNHGWRLSDSAENSITPYEAKFHSRESTDAGKRPILEVTFIPPEVTTAYLVINEVYYDVGDREVSGEKKSDPDNEWVEIYNPTDSAVDISGWKICEKDGCDTISSATPIPAKGFAILSGKSSTWETYWTLPAGVITINLPAEKIGSNGLKDDGDRVILKDASDKVIDAMSYGSDTTYFELPLSGRGKSLARIIKGYDTNLATDWIINATPNPGANPSIDGVETITFTWQGVEFLGSEPVLKEIPIEEEQSADENELINYE